MLPPDEGRVAILAGSGRLPQILAEGLRDGGANPLVLAIVPETGAWVSGFSHAHVPLTRLAAIISTMRRGDVRSIVLAGGIRFRPAITDFRLDWTTLKVLPGLFWKLRQGDNALLTFAITWLESQGFKVVGAHQLMPRLCAEEGNLTLLCPSPEDSKDIAAAMAECVRLGRLDIGQAAVAQNGGIIASEDRRGTQAMLENLAGARSGFARSGVLAKFAKPQQDLRVDMPAIGPETVAQAARAGLAGIVVDAGRTLVIDRAETVARANDLGVFISGVRRTAT